MDYPSGHAAKGSFSPSETTLSFDYRVRESASLAPQLMRYTSSSSREILHADFVDPGFHSTESVTFAEQGSPLLHAAQPFPPPVSMQNSALPGDFDPFMSPSGPSVSFIYGAQQVPQDDTFMPSHERDKTRSVSPSMAAAIPNGEQAVPTSSYPQHVASWYHTYQNAVIVNGPRIFVPQAIYQPHSEGDKERYVYLAKLQPPIIFQAHNSSEWGVPISQLLSKQAIHLVEGHEPAFDSCGTSIGIRVNWPGYRPFHKQVQTRDYTVKRRIISKMKLAKLVAKCLRKSMDTMSKQAMQVGSDRQWRVGSLGIQVEDVILVGLHHVSQGSWQPQLRLRRRVVWADSIVT